MARKKTGAQNNMPESHQSRLATIKVRQKANVNLGFVEVLRRLGFHDPQIDKIEQQANELIDFADELEK